MSATMLIRDFEKRGHLLGLITQNIDGLHGIAGVSDEKIVELHGTDRRATWGMREAI